MLPIPSGQKSYDFFGQSAIVWSILIKVYYSVKVQVICFYVDKSMVKSFQSLQPCDVILSRKQGWRIQIFFSCIYKPRVPQSVSFSWLMRLGRLWYTWDATETDIQQMRQDRSDNSLVWLFSRCCSAWKRGGNLDRKALGIGTQQTFCATAWNLLLLVIIIITTTN